MRRSFISAFFTAAIALRIFASASAMSSGRDPFSSSARRLNGKLQFRFGDRLFDFQGFGSQLGKRLTLADKISFVDEEIAHPTFNSAANGAGT